MKCLVTGATGFLGSHLRRALESRGHEVVGFSRGAGGSVLDETQVRAAAEGCEVAFHCAGRVSRDPRDAEELYRVHVEGTRVVLGACAAARVRRLVVASTSGTVAVSDDPHHVAVESDPPPIGIIGRWPYYRAKLFAEQLALSKNGPGLEVVCVNPSLLLGPGDARGSSTGDVRAFLEGSVLAVPQGGISFVDVRDAAEAMCLAMDHGCPGQRYLIGACNLTMRDFLGRLSRVAGVRAPRLALPASRELARVGATWASYLASRIGIAGAPDPVTAEMACCFWYLDPSKAQSELGFRARDPNVTLFDTVEDLRARGVVWPREDAAAPEAASAAR